MVAKIRSEELKKEIEKTWNNVCDMDNSLEFNERQELFIKTKELQAELKGIQEANQKWKDAVSKLKEKVSKYIIPSDPLLKIDIEDDIQLCFKELTTSEEKE